MTRFSTPISSRNDAETTVPNTPPNCSSPEPLSETARKHRLLRDDDPDADRDDDGGVAEREEEPERERARLPVSRRSLSILRIVLSIAEMWSASNA